MLKKRFTFVLRTNKKIGGAIDGQTDTPPPTRRKSRISSLCVILVIGAISLPLLASATPAGAVRSRTTPPIRKQLAELKGSDTAAGDEFGSSVAISGTTAVVGAQDAGTGAGRAYVFTKAAKGWKQVAELKPPAYGSTGFGYSVAISGTTAVVGAPDAEIGAGRAYVFTKTAKGWNQVAELKGSDTAGVDEFGYSVAISGTTAVVGAWGAGRAYVFTKRASGWKQVAELKGSDPVARAGFGSSVAISGTITIVGSENSRAYVFTRTAKGWKQVAVLKGSDIVAYGEYFGYSVAISGTTAVVGPNAAPIATGRAYVFTKTAKGWTQIAELKGSDTVAVDEFGYSVAISGTTAIVGALDHDRDAGRAYVFKA
jgi:hypothetical protein